MHFAILGLLEAAIQGEFETVVSHPLHFLIMFFPFAPMSRRMALHLPDFWCCPEGQVEAKTLPPLEPDFEPGPVAALRNRRQPVF